MRRFNLFLRSLSWGSRLQLLAIALILGYWIWLDYQRGIWPVSMVIIVFAWFLGWLVMPLMAAYPRQAFRIWGSFGIVYMVVFFVSRNQWWWRTVAAHFGRELALWLELSCGYWFISELKLREQRLAEDSSVRRSEFPENDDKRYP